YKPTSAVRWRSAPSHGGTTRRFEGQNPPGGSVIDYVLARRADKLSLKILGVDGAVVRELRAPNGPGLHRVAWALPRGPAPGAGFGPFGGPGAGPRAGGVRGAGAGPAPGSAGPAGAGAGMARAGGTAAGVESESAAEPIPQRRFG